MNIRVLVSLLTVLAVLLSCASASSIELTRPRPRTLSLSMVPEPRTANAAGVLIDRGASYILKADGAIIWESTLPHTLVNYVICSDGSIFGYAFDSDQEGSSTEWPPKAQARCYMFLVRIDGKGIMKYSNRISREQLPGATHTRRTASPEPFGAALGSDDTCQLFVRTGGTDKRCEVWRVRLQDGAIVERKELVFTHPDGRAADSAMPWEISHLGAEGVAATVSFVLPEHDTGQLRWGIGVVAVDPQANPLAVFYKRDVFATFPKWDSMLFRVDGDKLVFPAANKGAWSLQLRSEQHKKAWFASGINPR